MATQKKGKKVGRSKRNGQCARYAAEFRAQKSKARRLVAHYADHPHDKSAHAALRTLGGILGKTFVDPALPRKPENTKPGFAAWLRGNCGFKPGGMPHKATA